MDAALAAGQIDRGLPFVRREGVRLMKSSYPTSDEAARVIDEDLRKFYTSRGRAVDAQVTGAVTALQAIYRRNVFPIMKVTFGTYPDNLGHITSSGCFRCHDGSLTAKDGSTINADCEVPATSRSRGRRIRDRSAARTPQLAFLRTVDTPDPLQQGAEKTSRRQLPVPNFPASRRTDQRALRRGLARDPSLRSGRAAAGNSQNRSPAPDRAILG